MTWVLGILGGMRQAFPTVIDDEVVDGGSHFLMEGRAPIWSIPAATGLESLGSESGLVFGEDSSSSSVDTMGIMVVLSSSYSGCASMGSPGLQPGAPK